MPEEIDISDPRIWDSYWEGKKEKGMLTDPVYREVKHSLPKNRNGWILEAGCGSGNWTSHFYREGYKRIVGMDFSKNALRIARKREKNHLISGDVRNLPFRDGSFETVLSFGVIEHFKQPKILVDEMFRVLRPGGKIFIDTPNLICLHPIFRHIRRKKRTWNIGYEVSYTPFQLANIISRSGFKIEKTGTRDLQATLYPVAKILGQRTAEDLAALLEKHKYNVFGMLSFAIGVKER